MSRFNPPFKFRFFVGVFNGIFKFIFLNVGLSLLDPFDRSFLYAGIVNFYFAHFFSKGWLGKNRSGVLLSPNQPEGLINY